jgi:segregation and condensation protein A
MNEAATVHSSDPQVLAPIVEVAFGQPVEGQPLVREPEKFTGHPVKLSMFVGPLDLLLYLVRAHRYDICDIPIAQITQGYLGWMRLIEEVDLDDAGEFLLTAATLMQIKSRMLLPKHHSANEDALEEDPGDDPRRELVDKLLEFQRFQAAAETLREKREERSLLFTRAVPLNETLKGLPDEDQARAEAVLLANVSSFDLLKALQRVLDRVAEKPVALVKREPFTIQERTRQVLARLRGTRSASFGELCDDCESRLEVVITFLSVLELIRRGRAVVQQEKAFDEIRVELNRESSADSLAVV